MIILILRNIVAILFLFIMLLIISVFCYIYSFFFSRKNMNTILFKSFMIVRVVIFKIIGIKLIIKGLENIPSGAVIFASKHQSAFETSFFFNMFKEETLYCFKKEITNVPLWGRIAKSNGGILIDRHNPNSFSNFLSDIKNSLNQGISIAIFPEGTRVAIGEKVPLKRGIAKIYLDNKDYPIIPVALNTGMCLPKKSKLLYPATIIIEFLPAVKTGMNEEEFLIFLHNTINDNSDKLAELSKLETGKP